MTGQRRAKFNIIKFAMTSGIDWQDFVFIGIKISPRSKRSEIKQCKCIFLVSQSKILACWMYGNRQLCGRERQMMDDFLFWTESVREYMLLERDCV